MAERPPLRTITAAYPSAEHPRRGHFIEGIHLALADDYESEILAPLVNKTKAQIVRWGLRLGVPYERTWSCYEGETSPCRCCDSCLLREKAFQEVGIADPLVKRDRIPQR